jgi:hypothetical protein
MLTRIESRLYGGTAGSVQTGVESLSRREKFIDLTDQVPEISNQHSPITNLKHPFALSVSDDVVVRIPLTQAAREGLAISNADCKRMFQIGDWRMLVADFRNLVRQVYEFLPLGEGY